MCIVSMVMDSGFTSPPWRNPVTKTPLPDTEAVEAIKKFIALVEAARQYDAASKQPDCEDPKKAEFEKIVLYKLEEIEKRLSLMEKK